jgi:hypothetical protein
MLRRGLAALGSEVVGGLRFVCSDMWRPYLNVIVAKVAQALPVLDRFHGTWSEYAINAVFLENYWTDGSVKPQARRFDDFVISTRSIGPILATTPVITRTSDAAGAGWEVEVATDPEGRDVVWRSKPMAADAMNLTVDSANGEFSRSCADKTGLAVGQDYWTRIRRQGETEWAPWHAPFRQ